MNAPATRKNLLLTTPGVGKGVYVIEKCRKEAEALKKAAKTCYYPMLALKQLQALSSGLNGKNNVFLSNIKDFQTNTFLKVIVFVKGIRATVMRGPNDSLWVTKLELSDGYDSIALRGQDRPGVYTVTGGKSDGDIKLKYRKNGRVTSKDDRIVVVADTSFSEAKEAAEITAQNLEAIARIPNIPEFDLFFSPVGSPLGNMYTEYNPLKLTQGYAFAGLLADAMEQTANKKRLRWFSDAGGAVVLTQALTVLAVKGPLFKGQNHTVNMYMAPPDTEPALLAAKKLGMKPHVDFAKGNGSVRACANAMRINAKRVLDKNDDYSAKDYAEDLAKGGMTTASAAAVLTSLSAGVVSSTALTMMGVILGGISAAQLGVKVILHRLKMKR